MSKASEAFGGFSVSEGVEPRAPAGVLEHVPILSADVFWDALDRLAATVWALADAVWTASLTHTPVLAISLGLVAALPLVWLAGMLIRTRRAHPDAEAGDRTHGWHRSATAAAGHGGQGGDDGSAGDEGDVEGIRAGHATMAWRHPSRPPATMLIRILDGDPETGREVLLGDLRVLRIGREADNDVCLRDPTVHRYHAVISRSADDGLVVSDLSGRTGNGVVLNGARISTHPLADGDRLTLGRAELLVVMS